MPDADRHDAGEGVEVPPARLVPHVLHVPFDDHQRVAVVGDARRATRTAAAGRAPRRAMGPSYGAGRMIDDRERSAFTSVAMAEAPSGVQANTAKTAPILATAH